MTAPSKFQFHKGTIETPCLAAVILIVTYFNSIKVRLKLRPSIVLVAVYFNFNSIKVRLKLAPGTLRARLEPISIP